MHQNLPRRIMHEPDLTSAKAVFEILVREHAEMLEAYLRSVLGPTADMDDIFQETMLVAYRRLDDYDKKRPFGAWLRGIARVLILEHARKGMSRPRTRDPLILDGIDRRFETIENQPGDTFSERTRPLLDCVEKLPEKMRLSIELVYIRGLSIAEASASLSTGVEAMKKRVQRSRLLLADCLGISAPHD